MIVNMSELSPSECYFALTQAVIPRPIAWVLSENVTGNLNLAPYSFFTGICSDPPIVMISAGKKENEGEVGQPKDTRANIIERKFHVIHIPDVSDLTAVNSSAASLPAGESEIESLELEIETMPGFPLPRLKASKVALGCEFLKVDELGRQKQAVIYSEVKCIYFADEVAEVKEGRLIVDADKVNPLARLGGPWYSQIGEKLKVVRPK